MVTARADSGRTEGPGAAVSSRGPRARCRLLPEPRLLTAGSSRRQSWACPAVSLSPLQPPAGRGLPSCSGFWPDSWIGQGSSWLRALVSKHSSSMAQVLPAAPSDGPGAVCSLSSRSRACIFLSGALPPDVSQDSGGRGNNVHHSGLTVSRVSSPSA